MNYWPAYVFIIILVLIVFKLQNWARNSGNNPQNTKKPAVRKAESNKPARKKVLGTAEAVMLLTKAETNGDRELLFRIWRETEDEKIRFSVYEDLIRSEKQVRFGGMDWIVLDQTEDRQLLLSKYALKGFKFGDDKSKRIHYEGEGYYYTFNCT